MKERPHVSNISQINVSINMMKSIYLTFVGVTFSGKLDGDSKAPCQQHLTEDEHNEKEKSVINKAINGLSAYWKDAKFNDFEVINTKISCGVDTLKWMTMIK